MLREGVGAIDTLVLMPVAGIGAGQGAQHHHPGHEAQIGVRFTGPDKLVHLIGAGEVGQRLGRGFADRFHRAAQIGEGITDQNQPAALTLHALFSHAPQTRSQRRADCRWPHQRNRGVSGPQLRDGRAASICYYINKLT